MIDWLYTLPDWALLAFWAALLAGLARGSGSDRTQQAFMLFHRVPRCLWTLRGNAHL